MEAYHKDDRMKNSSMNAAPKGRMPAIRTVNGVFMYLGLVLASVNGNR